MSAASPFAIEGAGRDGASVDLRAIYAHPDFLALAEELERLSIPCPATGCHLWCGALTEKGYARIYFRGAMRRGHRVAWELANGPIPIGMDVCHRCDVPACVNADHLFLGTHLENIADMEMKGRQRGPFTKNSPSRNRRFSHDDIAAIRASADFSRVIAARFGVSVDTINDIRAGRSYAHPPMVERDPQTKRNSGAKLDAETVRAIRGSSSTVGDLAAEYGVSLSTIREIVNRKSWAHVQ